MSTEVEQSNIKESVANGLVEWSDILETSEHLVNSAGEQARNSAGSGRTRPGMR